MIKTVFTFFQVQIENSSMRREISLVEYNWLDFLPTGTDSGQSVIPYKRNLVNNFCAFINGHIYCVKTYNHYQ